MAKNVLRPLITLTTDFGLGSPYVAQMKAVILSRHPTVHIVDITHAVAAQNVLDGAIVLGDVCLRFPKNTIHIAVVDPGVGTDRRIVCATIDGQFFIAPDNGLLTCVLASAKATQIVHLTKRTYFQHEVSNTFHGRDIMAPVAAHLSLGLNPRRLGELIAVETLQRLTIPSPTIQPGRIEGQILQIDSFGNLVTNISDEHLAAVGDNALPVIECLGRSISGIATSYGHAAPGELIATIGSSHRLEIALVNGNAAQELGAKHETPLVVRW